MEPASQYNKRAGTSGISGQLYETKLISLILFRLLHDVDVEHFYLASNMDDIGAFDDICLKLKLSGRDRQIIVLIQAKHKEKDENVLRYDLIQELSASFIQVKQKFLSNDTLFKGKFEDTDCVFILYTNAKYCDDCNIVASDRTDPSVAPAFKQTWRPYQSEISDQLNKLVATGDAQGYQAEYNSTHLQLANETILEQELTILAENLTKFLGDKSSLSMNMMLDKYILRYHVILANSVVHVSEVQSEPKKVEQWRDLTFRHSFFNTDDKVVAMFRSKLIEQIFKTHVITKHDSKSSDEAAVDRLITLFLSSPCALTLSPLIGTHIIYKDGNLEFSADRPISDLEKLKQINISPTTVDEAETTVATNILSTLKIKVPATFGNVDMKIPGNEKKIEKRLNTLTDFIVGLCEQSEFIDPYEVVTIDDSLGDGFLNLNGGISSAVGNLLVYDNVSKYLMFTTNPTLLPNNAKALFYKLQNKIVDLYLYRFDVSAVVTFPKLVFDFTHEANTITKLAVVFEKQSNHFGVEKLLIKEIEQYVRTSGPHNLSINSDSMAIHYHHEIQKWWMSSKTAKFLTKSKHNNIYQLAINNIVTEPQLTALHTTFNINNMKYFGYSFSTNSLQELSRTIVVTDVYTLTTIKVIQSVKTTYSVVDLDLLLNLTVNDFTALKTELSRTKKVVIVICNVIKHSPTLYKRLYEVAVATDKKTIVVITNNEFLETAQEYFLKANLLHDETQSLTDLTPESRRQIMKNAEVIFQGEKINLSIILDEAADEYINMIKGLILNKIIRNETITIGKSLSNSSYEKIKHLYVDRRVRQVSSEKDDEVRDYDLKTLNDIQDNAVVILAEAGMGKSTLLTHLSLKTKEIDKQLWIIRINLLDHTKQFKKWQNDETIIDNLEVIKFMSQVVLDNDEITISLKEIKDKVYLESCTSDRVGDNDEKVFELNMFLYCYNERTLIFLFDGYDEICPHYKSIVIKLFNIVKHFCREHKMWITGRPYSEVLVDLQKVVDMSYEINYLNKTEQAMYLDNIWKEKLTPDKLNDDHYKTIKSLLDFNELSNYIDLSLYFTFKRFFDHFYRYVHNNLIYDPEMAELDKLGTSDETDSKSADVDFIENENESSTINARELEIMGTPLLLYLLANHIIINIIYNNKKIKKAHLFTIYEMFIETQVDEIRFQVKNKMDISRPELARIFEKERSDFINMHKKLGAHAMLGDLFLYYDEFKEMRPFNTDFPELQSMLDIIKNGTEKSGLISYVTTDNIPIFIHRTFGEYFATETISDILKSNKFGFYNKKLLIMSLFYYNDGVFYSYVQNKIEIDEELNEIIENLKSDAIGFNYNQDLSTLIVETCSEKAYIRMYSASLEDYQDNYLDILNEELNKILELKLDENERIDCNRNFIDNYIIGYMKPHYKKLCNDVFIDKRFL